MNRSLLGLLLLATGLALALRCLHLGERPLHNDEAVNAVKFGKLWAGGGYRYDPNEHHGPSLYYGALALGRLTSAPDFDHFTEARLRLEPVLFGAGLVLLLLLLADGLGRSGTFWAALFTAVSPALVFYSRDFIHESLLVFYTFLALGAGWRYWRTRSIGWVLLAGAALGLMYATKETFVIALGAAALALFLNQAWARVVDASGPPLRAPRLKVVHLLVGLAVWAFVGVLLFSSFFTNWAGPLDSLRSYTPWSQRAAGQSIHVHPWTFYLHRLLWFHPARGPVWTEGLILVLAVAGACAGFRRRLLAGANASLVRFLALYAFLLTAFYSLLAYKTPWCLLGFWHGAILLAGVGAAACLERMKARGAKIAVAVLLLLGAGHLAWQAWQQGTEYAADPRNPYVYAQTSSDLLDLVSTVQSAASVSPAGDATLIKVIAPEEDYWPLPWYLRHFKHTGWWSQMPADPYAPILIVSPQFAFPYDQARLHLMGFYGLRPQVPLALFLETNLWKQWLARQPAGPVRAPADEHN